MNIKQKCMEFFKKETVLVVATILAIISAFFVTPSEAYLDYIDWRVLGILLSLMIIMTGLQRTGLFDSIGAKLLGKTKNTRQLAMILVFLCFFFSMLITNDVALFTFVPFAMIMLKKCGQEKLLIPVLVLQTIAANLGSMLTPIGNPQNLYLYNLSGMGMGEFIGVMLPYTVISGILLVGAIFICCKNEPIAEVALETEELDAETRKRNKVNNILYLALFILSLLVVMKVFPYQTLLQFCFILAIAFDKEVLKEVDCSLLLTFIAFFIFTGNMGNLDIIRDTLQQLVGGKEFLVGVLASQAISNVPAALLLSGFTTDYRELLIGVNVGGLGTLIASMASLISYKLFVKEYTEQKGKYFWTFTAANIIFLGILMVAKLFL